MLGTTKEALRAVRSVFTYLQWKLRTARAREIKQTKNRIYDLEDEFEKLNSDKNPSPDKLQLSQRVLHRIAQEKEYLQYTSDTYVGDSGGDNDTNKKRSIYNAN